MNKACKELLEKSIELDWGDEAPLFKGVYIIQQRRLHDSGFRMMYVIGHTEYDDKIKDFSKTNFSKKMCSITSERMKRFCKTNSHPQSGEHITKVKSSRGRWKHRLCIQT